MVYFIKSIGFCQTTNSEKIFFENFLPHTRDFEKFSKLDEFSKYWESLGSKFNN